MIKSIKRRLKSVMSNYEYEKMMYYCDTIKGKKNTYVYSYKIRGGRKNPDKFFYIFRYDVPAYGILAVARTMPDNLLWAKRNGYIPVVMLEYRWNYKRKELLNNNVWDYFFQQPGGYSLEEVLRSKNVLVGMLREHKGNMNTFISEDPGHYFGKDAQLYSLCVRLNEDIKVKLEQYFKKLFENKHNILGVALREGFGVHASVGNQHAKKHAHSINIEIAIEQVKQYMIKWNCDYIFLTTAYTDSIIQFSNVFGKQVIYTERERLLMSEHAENLRLLDENCDVLDTSKYNEDHKFWDQYSNFDLYGNEQKVYDYLVEVYGLSQCNYLLADESSAVMAAEIWNGNKYKDIKFFNKEKTSSFY